jgi:uncharacterized lipoprotein YajG
MKTYLLTLLTAGLLLLGCARPIEHLAVATGKPLHHMHHVQRVNAHHRLTQ